MDRNDTSNNNDNQDKVEKLFIERKFEHTDPTDTNAQNIKESSYMERREEFVPPSESTPFHDSHIENEHTTIHSNDTSMAENKEGKSNLWLRIAVIIGLLVLLFFISIGIVRFVPKLISSISAGAVNLTNIFDKKDDLEISVTPSEVNAGETFTVNWKNNTDDKDGYYTFSFKCTSGITLTYNSVSGKKPVICDTLFPLPDNSSTYGFGVDSTNTTTTVVPVNVSFLNKGDNKLKLTNSTELSVRGRGSNGSNIATTTTSYPRGTSTTYPTNNQTGSQSGNTSSSGSYYPAGGNPDLAVELVRSGVVTGSGVSQSGNISSSDKVLVQFRVANRGNAPTGSWTLQVNIPTTVPSDRVRTALQPSIGPGGSYEFTLMFDNYDSTARNVLISVSASKDINSSNNSLTVPFSFQGNTSGSKADLTVRILDVGIIDSGRFYKTTSFNENDDIAVRFEVENIGGRESGPWGFEIEVPSFGDDILWRKNLSSLAAGAKTVFTLQFDGPDSSKDEIRVTVDQDDEVDENNENNNEDREKISIDN